jgi:hypothetical protein
MHHQAHQDLVDAEDFQEEEDEIAMDFDNIEALQDFLGEQNPRIFRPGPVNTGHQQIEQRIVQVWPDLQPGRPDWTLRVAY